LASIESLKIDLGIGAVKSLSKKDASKIKSDLRAEILGEQKKLYIPTSIQAKISRDDIRDFKNAVKSKLTGLSVDVKVNAKDGGFAGSEQGAAGLMQYMRSQGMVGKTASGMEMRLGKGGDDIKQQLSDAVRSAEKIKSVFDGVAKNIATTGKSIASVQGKRLGLANVPLMAGAMEKRIERSASAIEGTASFDALKSLYPEINKTIVSLAALRGQVQQNTSKLSGFSLIIGLAAFAGVPLAKSIVRLTGSADKFSKLLDELGPRLETALTKAASNILNATSSRLLSGSSVAGLLSAGSVAGLLPPAYRGIGPSAGPAGLLPPAYRGIGPSAKPAGLLPSLSSAGRSNAIIEALIASTGPRLLPSGGGDDSLGKLAAPRQTKDAIDAILRNYFKVLEVQVKEVFSAPPVKKESLNIFDHLDTEQYFNYLAQARINAENAIKQSIEEGKQVAKQNRESYVQRANIREIGQPLLGGRQVTPPKMLSAATGFYRGAATPPPLPETQAQLFARREREARMRSVLRGVDVMGETPTRAPARYSYANRPAMPRRPTSAIVPYEAGGALVPSGGGGGGVPPVPPRGGGFFGGMQFNMPQLPGAGLVREIGTEFGFAAKQVLLFGTAYKALAFIQGFPAQVGDAVGALQSFRNTLGAISPSAEEAAESSQFILDIVDKYNTPIQSARDGFTKLYASMKPTGFSGDEIRDLFLGISQAAATFGMSADKVDRVNYAFAQMASKGQVMSEELKGQLGDVLPGAMGIFAEAAGFEGPDAITKFSKALEDGAYKGGAMKTLLTNVGSIMQKEFGPGAEGAARTFQGVMNRMQNSTKLLYEAFEPVAVGFLNSVVMPLTSGLKTVTDGFNAFFTGTNAKTAGGFAFAQELEKLRPTFEGLRTNAIALAQVFGEFAKVALSVGSALLQIAGNPIVGFMAKIYAIMVPLNMALGVMRGLWALNSLQLLLFNARVAMGVPTLSAFRGMMQATGATAAVTATSIRTAGLTLRTFFASTGVGLILVGISLLIERFMSINQALADTRAKAIGAAQAIRSMTKTEAILDERKTVSAIKLLETLQTRKRSYEGSTDVSLTKSEASLLEDVGVPVNKGGVGGGQYMDPTMLESHKQRLETVNLAELRNRQRVINNDENEARQTAAITPITGGDGDAGATKIKDKQKYVSDMAKLLQQEMQQKINAINQDASISDREREIQAAATRYDYELLINKAEYSAGINDENKKDILNRGQYLADLQKTLKAENELSRQRYENVVTSPLRDMLSEDKKAIIELEAAEKMLSEGRTERTYVETREIQIKQALVGLDEKQIQVLQPLIDLILKAAAARDQLTEASKRNLAFTEKMNELRNQLALAQILDPRAERRAQIKQETPGLSDAQVESRAALEEQVAAAAKSRDQLRSIASTIGDSFGEAFKGIITGSMTVREALAGLFQSIANSFADMVAQMIAEWIKMMILKGIEAIINPMAGLGNLGGGISSGLSSGFSAGAASAVPTDAAGWGASFGTSLKFANGGIAPGGFTAFANGGMVTGPTMGLVGEGRYNEAIVPLPDGKSIPVELAGGGSSSPTVIVNVDAKGSQVEGNEQNANQLGRVISAAVQTELIKQQRPGGLLAR
jgi:tape measure domain-containing protein